MKITDLKGKRIVVTGGAGFIGSHLVERLLEIGAHVTCVDNLLTGNADNIAPFFKNRRFEFINHNVTLDLYLADKVDAILHFASPASPIDYAKLPIETLKVGAIGTHKMLGLAKAKQARFLLASTSEVYGDPLVHPQAETYFGNVNPIGPRGVYDEAKRYAEALTMAYHRVHGVETRIARIFNTYGPRMRPNDGRAVPAFITQALKNKPVTIFGDGKQTRSFCYIDDQVEGLLRLLVSDFAEPFNIGNPEEITIEQCAKLIISIIGSKSRVVYKDLPVDDPKVRRPDILKALCLLDWAPEVSFAKGFKKTIAWFRRMK